MNIVINQINHSSLHAEFDKKITQNTKIKNNYTIASYITFQITF